MHDASPLSTSVFTCPAVCWSQRHQHLWPVRFNANPLRIPELDVEDIGDLPQVARPAQEGQADDAAGPAEGQSSGPKPPALIYFEALARAWECDPAEVFAELDNGSAAWAFKMFATCAIFHTTVSGLCLICLCHV